MQTFNMQGYQFNWFMFQVIASLKAEFSMARLTDLMTHLHNTTGTQFIFNEDGVIIDIAY